MRYTVNLLFFTSAASLLFLAASSGNAQIVGQVDADIHHGFTIVNTTLPPGRYVFRWSPGSNQDRTMLVTSGDGNKSVEFLVRQSTDSLTPTHSDLIFNRYGDKEFLTRIYERGDKSGVAVAEPSRAEERLKKEGETAVEHTEEQSQ